MDFTVLVSKNDEYVDRLSLLLSQNQEDTNQPNSKSPSDPSESQHASLQSIWIARTCPGLSTETKDIILQSRRTSTRSQYEVYLLQWEKFCSKVSVDPLSASISTVLKFLTELFNKGLIYSAINTARSVLRSNLFVDGKPIEEHYMVVKFLKGVFNLRPKLLRTSYIWDTNVILKKLSNLSPQIAFL